MTPRGIRKFQQPKMRSSVKLAALVIALLVVEIEALGLLGGSSKELPASDEVRALVRKFEPKIRELYPGELKSIEPLTYKTQVVAGTNYLIRARATDTADRSSIVHLAIWKTLFRGSQFGGLRTQVDEQTPLTRF